MLKDNKVVKFIGDKWYIICFVLGLAFYVSYVVYGFVEIPYESYIDKFYMIEPFYNGTLKFSDLLIPYTENGMLAANVFFLFNLKFFHFSVFAESMMNVILVAIVGLIAMAKFANIVSPEKKWFYYIAIAVMTVPLFTSMQQSAGGMSLQVRFGLAAFVVVSYMIDRFLIEKKGNIYYAITMVMIFLSLDFFGSSYSFSGVPFICLTVLIYVIGERKFDIKSLLIIVAYFAATVLYFFEYGFFNIQTQETRVVDGGLLQKALEFLKNIKSIGKGLIYWNGSCLLGRSMFEDGHISNNKYLFVGAMFTVLILISLVIYFKYRMYKITLIPIFWMGYNLMLYFIISIGRIEMIRSLGEAWVTSSWYTVHTKILTVSVIGIYLYYFNNLQGKAVLFRKVSIAIVHVALLTLMAMGTFWSLVRVPFEKANVQMAQSYFYVESKEDLPVGPDGNTPLFKDQETSWTAISLLRKYHLSLFRE